MKKRLKSIICAAVLAFTASTQAFAAAGDTVLLKVTPSKPVIDSSLSDTAPDWRESEDVNGVETNAGNAILKNTVKNGSVYNDFENNAEIGSGGVRGVWAGGTTDRSPEIIPTDDVEYFNSVMKESNPDSASAQPDSSAPGEIPVPVGEILRNSRKSPPAVGSPGNPRPPEKAAVLALPRRPHPGAEIPKNRAAKHHTAESFPGNPAAILHTAGKSADKQKNQGTLYRGAFFPRRERGWRPCWTVC